MGRGADRCARTGRRQTYGLRPAAILTTHHHWDHAGGNKRFIELAAREGIELRVYGGDERVDALTDRVAHGDTLELAGGGLRVRALDTRCHTRGSISYVTSGEPGSVFTGDTLFPCGCGRFFEGTAAEMHRALMDVLAALPPATLVYPGHEYTLANMAFASHVEPENAVLAAKLARCRALRERGEPTVPSTIADELACNPFMRLTEPTVHAFALRHSGRPDTTRLSPVEVMQALRDAKNSFRA